MSTVQEIAEFLEKKWYDRSGLVASLFVSSCAVFTLILSHQNLALAVLGTLLCDAVIVALWVWSRHPPITPPNKIGFLISISASDDGEGKKLQEDFIRPLRELIKSGRTGHAFHTLEIPQFIACTIQDQEQALALRIKCRAHFMIWGRVRLRTVNGKEAHILDLEGAVAHQPIPDHLANALAQEFSELMPRKLHLSAENDLFAFQFTSEWTDLVARYIIGLAAAVSGDWDYSESLFRDVREKLHGKNTQFPIYTKLKERLPVRISELYEARANLAYLRWAKSKDESDLKDVESHLANLAPVHQEKPSAHYLSAICAFVRHGDIQSAIQKVKEIKAPDNALWHLNMAFLLGYQGELKNAIRHYRLSAAYDVPTDELSQVEDFIVWVLQKNAEKYQLYFCLGFFNWKLKGDYIQASKDFQSFLSACNEFAFKKEQELARNWVAELEQKLP